MTASTVASAREALEAARHSTESVDLSWLAPEAERDSWTLADDSLRFVAALVAAVRPTTIVEFGSGVSTRVLAAACGELGEPGAVVALENDPEFARRTSRQLAGDACGSMASVVLTHLVVRRWYGRNVPVYDLPEGMFQDPAPQLILVDGPPLPLGGRAGSLLQAVHLGRPGTVVLLDDADRPSEQRALAMAEEVLRGHIEVMRLDGYAKGLAAVVVRCATHHSPMPSADNASKACRSVATGGNWPPRSEHLEER